MNWTKALGRYWQWKIWGPDRLYTFGIKNQIKSKEEAKVRTS